MGSRVSADIKFMMYETSKAKFWWESSVPWNVCLPIQIDWVVRQKPVFLKHFGCFPSSKGRKRLSTN